MGLLLIGYMLIGWHHHWLVRIVAVLNIEVQMLRLRRARSCLRIRACPLLCAADRSIVINCSILAERRLLWLSVLAQWGGDHHNRLLLVAAHFNWSPVHLLGRLQGLLLRYRLVKHIAMMVSPSGRLWHSVPLTIDILCHVNRTYWSSFDYSVTVVTSLGLSHPNMWAVVPHLLTWIDAREEGVT
jgi:hypothetical protein